jgi:hypothetical protein
MSLGDRVTQLHPRALGSSGTSGALLTWAPEEELIITLASISVLVSDYGLDDWVIDVRSPAEEKGFFL